MESRLLTINEVSECLRCSVPTIRRRLAERRIGHGRFPLPITGRNKKARWRLEDVAAWNENENADDDVPQAETAIQRTRRVRTVRNALKEIGVKIK